MQQRDNQLFGHIALHYKLVTRDQLVAALQQQSREGGRPRLGEILVAQGILTRHQMDQLLAVQAQVEAQQAEEQASSGVGPVSPTTSTTPPPAAAPSASGATASGVGQAPSPSPAAGAAQAVGSSGTPRSMDELLRMAVARQASDLHLHSTQPIRLRVHGAFVEEGEASLSNEESYRLIASLLDDGQRADLEHKGQVDFAYTLADCARFRVNAYRQKNGTDAVFRVIALRPPSLSGLGLPTDLARFANFHQGLVLITGPAGCGKSSTLAALVNLINEERRNHIITIEDPIEYLHPPQRCVVNQRQVGPHTRSFARALRAAMREDPDVIVIGELRDLETISLALTAAETGHLVLATLHTTNAISTINRMVGAFPPAQQAQIRTMVSESLRGIVSQRLVRNREGSGRLPALEVLSCTKAVSNLIRESKTFQIASIIQTGGSQGMRLLDHSLRELVTKGLVPREEAVRHCEDPKTIPAR